MFLPDQGVFAGADMVAGIYIPQLKNQFKYKVFGELSTVSYSIHRELYPVRGLGTISPKGFTRGPRTIAGSLVFTVFDRHVLYEVQQAMADYYVMQLKENGYGNADNYKKLRFLTDEIPPFDIIISMANGENPVGSCLRIYGARITNEGQTMSIEDLITENTMQYLATGIDLMEPAFEDYGGDPRRNLDYNDTSYSLTPIHSEFDQEGNPLEFNGENYYGTIVVTPTNGNGYGVWKANAADPWIHIDTGSTGQGMGRIRYHVDPLPIKTYVNGEPVYDPTYRTGKIGIGGTEVSISQSVKIPSTPNEEG